MRSFFSLLPLLLMLCGCAHNSPYRHAETDFTQTIARKQELHASDVMQPKKKFLRECARGICTIAVEFASVELLKPYEGRALHQGEELEKAAIRLALKMAGEALLLLLEE